MKRYLLITSRSFRLLALVFLLAWSLSIFSVEVTQAEQNDRVGENETATAVENTQAQGWIPTTPPTDDFDWIQLTSGEWLKGELIALYDDDLEFDSDELDLLNLDWEDVKQVRGHQAFSILFDVPSDRPIIITGHVQIIDDKVYVATAEGTQVFDRQQLIAITQGALKERNYWSAKLSLGLNISEGNTDQFQYNSKANIQRRTPRTRMNLDYLGNYTTTDDYVTNENQRITGNFDILKTKNYFWRPVFGEYYRDPFQNIEYRSTLGAGIGYHIIDNSKTTWDIFGGLAYQYTSFVSAEPGQDTSASTPALVVGTDFDIELSKKVDFKFNYDFMLVNEESGQYTHHVVGTLETELTDIIDIDLSLVWDRTQKPTARADASIPETDDFQLIFWVGVEF